MRLFIFIFLLPLTISLLGKEHGHRAVKADVLSVSKTHSDVEEFSRARKRYLELERKFEKEKDKSERMARKVRLDRDRPQWYDVGGRFRRDQALRQLRQGGIQIRQLRRQMTDVWKQQVSAADRLRKKRLQGTLDKERLDLLRVHDKEWLERLEKEHKTGGLFLEALETERRYYKALRSRILPPAQAAEVLRALQRIRQMEK